MFVTLYGPILADLPRGRLATLNPTGEIQECHRSIPPTKSWTRHYRGSLLLQVLNLTRGRCRHRFGIHSVTYLQSLAEESPLLGFGPFDAL